MPYYTYKTTEQWKNVKTKYSKNDTSKVTLKLAISWNSRHTFKTMKELYKLKYNKYY